MGYVLPILKSNPAFCSCLQLLQQLPAERVEQKEIPAEHTVLKSTFDSLVQRCQLAAGDPVSAPSVAQPRKKKPI